MTQDDNFHALLHTARFLHKYVHVLNAEQLRGAASRMRWQIESDEANFGVAFIDHILNKLSQTSNLKEACHYVSVRGEILGDRCKGKLGEAKSFDDYSNCIKLAETLSEETFKSYTALRKRAGLGVENVYGHVQYILFMDEFLSKFPTRKHFDKWNELLWNFNEFKHVAIGYMAELFSDIPEDNQFFQKARTKMNVWITADHVKHWLKSYRKSPGIGFAILFFFFTHLKEGKSILDRNSSVILDLTTQRYRELKNPAVDIAFLLAARQESNWFRMDKKEPNLPCIRDIYSRLGMPGQGDPCSTHWEMICGLSLILQDKSKDVDTAKVVEYWQAALSHQYAGVSFQHKVFYSKRTSAVVDFQGCTANKTMLSADQHTQLVGRVTDDGCRISFQCGDSSLLAAVAKGTIQDTNFGIDHYFVLEFGRRLLAHAQGTVDGSGRKRP